MKGPGFLCVSVSNVRVFVGLMKGEGFLCVSVSNVCVFAGIELALVK